MAGEAAARYRARVDAVLAQRTRLRGKEPPGDLLAGLPPDHPLLIADPRRPLDPNLAAIAEYVEADDLIVDAGGGAGRISLPLALRCRSVVNVEPSGAMGDGFRANAARASIDNTRVIESNWLAAEPPQGTLALANHVAYHTRDIVPFVEKLEQAGTRRVVDHGQRPAAAVMAPRAVPGIAPRAGGGRARARQKQAVSNYKVRISS
jgi:hypothetical protein